MDKSTVLKVLDEIIVNSHLSPHISIYYYVRIFEKHDPIFDVFVYELGNSFTPEDLNWTEWEWGEDKEAAFASLENIVNDFETEDLVDYGIGPEWYFVCKEILEYTCSRLECE